MPWTRKVLNLPRQVGALPEPYAFLREIEQCTLSSTESGLPVSRCWLNLTVIHAHGRATSLCRMV